MINTPPSAEQIARHYSAAMDSVNLINALVAKANRTEEEDDCIARNAEHLKLMVDKDFWTSENLLPLQNAITAAEAAGQSEGN